MRKAPELPPPSGLYDEFSARFPYDETDDQLAAIDATLDDLVAGRPMDRLICGDVGFGKTEVALRAAFVTAMNGSRWRSWCRPRCSPASIIKTFSERFRGLPLNIGQASRLAGLDAPVYVASRGVLKATVGFDLHRGAVAAADRQPLREVAEVAEAAHRVGVLEGLNDAENLGAIARSSGRPRHRRAGTRSDLHRPVLPAR